VFKTAFLTLVQFQHGTVDNASENLPHNFGMGWVLTEAFSDELEVTELGKEPPGTLLVIVHVSFEIFDNVWKF
jgi:hypothetical protein